MLLKICTTGSSRPINAFMSPLKLSLETCNTESTVANATNVSMITLVHIGPLKPVVYMRVRLNFFNRPLALTTHVRRLHRNYA